MQVNVGTTDRALRILFGVLLILLTVFQVIGPWGWLGLIAIATGALRFCPAYKILGLNTCPKPE
jgi:hypothetical protein